MTIPLEEIFAAMGQSAVVTAPRAERAVTTTIVWLSPDAPEAADLVRNQPIRMMALKRAEVTDIPIVPNETVIEAVGIEGGAEKAWRVESIARVEDDLIRVVVAPNDECCD